MNPNVKLLPNQRESLSNPEKYKRLVGKLNYLTVTHPDIFFAVSVVSQFLNSPCEDHWNVVICTLKCIKGSLRKKVCYMITITILKSFVIQMMIGQDLHLIEDQLPLLSRTNINPDK